MNMRNGFVTVVCECELEPQSGDQMSFSVELPGEYEVYVLTIEE